MQHKRVDTHAAHTQFGRIMDQAAEKNERFVIERRGRRSSSIKLGKTARAANGSGFTWRTKLPAATGVRSVESLVQETAALRMNLSIHKETRSWLSNTNASMSTVIARRNPTPGPAGCPRPNGATAYHRSSRRTAGRSGCATRR